MPGKPKMGWFKRRRANRAKQKFIHGGPNAARAMYHNPFAGIGFLILIVIVLLGAGYIGVVDFLSMIMLSVGLIITFIGMKLWRFLMIGIGILIIFGSILYMSWLMSGGGIPFLS